jgi:5-methylcytosine-specific restriction endonuclease McrA
MAGAEPTPAFVCEAIPKRRVRDRRGEVWRDAPTLSCEHCSKSFRPKRSDRLRFCSRDCSFKKLKEVGRLSVGYVRKEHYPSSRVWVANCRRCSLPFVSRTNVAFCSDDCRASPRQVEVSCVECGKLFIRTIGMWQHYCGDDCRDRRAATARSKAKKKRRSKYGKHWRKRARVLGVEYELVSSLKVFERDGWRCQICGCKTPSHLKGAAHPRAPTIDHRIPISKGGPHTYANIQCACRQCNTRKSNTVVIGQLPLFQIVQPNQ